MELQKQLLEFSKPSDSDSTSEQVVGVPLNRGAKKLYICSNCNIKFIDWICNNRKYCSRKCYMSSPTSKNCIKHRSFNKILNCKICNKNFYTYNNKICCSKICSKINNKNIKKKWNENNKDKILKSKRLWKKKNIEKIREYHRNWSENNKHKLLKYDYARIIWRNNNQEYIKQYRKRYNKENRDKIKINNRLSHSNRYKMDINYKIALSLRNRMKQALKQSKKSKITKELVGCSFKKLKQHLEKQFTLGMNWKNYGFGWHIDHIRPCSSFDLSKSEEQQKCFHYTNLQPLWATENFKKNKFLKRQEIIEIDSEEEGFMKGYADKDEVV